jgi:hypothetical protein
MKKWPWMLIAAALFWAAPFAIFGSSWEMIAAWFCGAVGAKWLVFGIMDWAAKSDAANPVLRWVIRVSDSSTNEDDSV